VLGLPHGLAVLHGKTRRGGLVFDIADLVKDAVILPRPSFRQCAATTSRVFEACIESLVQAEALDFMIDTVKAIALDIGRQAQ
jgi:CRISPR-associated protein Cas1